MDQEECESSCNAQANLYQDENDEEKQDAFDQQRACIVSETCDSLEEGVCYNEEVFSF